MIFHFVSTLCLPLSFASAARTCLAGVVADIAATFVPMTDMVPIFLARTVEGLAAFEDTLLKRDGFFQRQEHFEAKIEAVRLELDRNSRAKTVFANPDAVQLLIASLTAESLLDGLGVDGDGAVRRQQFVFASAVLLTTDVAMRTIRANPPLLRQLWQYVESPTFLDPVQLQYWCRCAGGLLLSGGDGATLSGGDEPPVAGLGTLLRHLLRHLHSDAVAVLLKCLLSVLAVPGCASSWTPLAALGRPCGPPPPRPPARAAPPPPPPPAPPPPPPAAPATRPPSALRPPPPRPDPTRPPHCPSPLRPAHPSPARQRRTTSYHRQAWLPAAAALRVGGGAAVRHRTAALLTRVCRQRGRRAALGVRRDPVPRGLGRAAAGLP
jgi:hypothetical protein